MNIITRNNYEEFFLDYIEGEINAQEEAALWVFLMNNPDLKKELDEMMEMELTLEKPSVLNESTQLKEIPFRENFDDFCIAHIEDDLDAYEKQAFENYIDSHPEKETELKLYRNTKLKADNSIVFTHKRDLKKKNKGLIFRQFILTSLSTAASIMILFSVWMTEIETPSSQIETEQLSHKIVSPIIKPDTTKLARPNKVTADKKMGNNGKSFNKTKTTLKRTIKGKIINKQIYKMDALPIKAEVMPKQPVKESEVKILVAHNIITPVSLSHKTGMELASNKQNNRTLPEKAGLETLGLSWKSSKVEKNRGKKSTLLKIANIGVNHIGRIAGKKINLEKVYDPKSDKMKIAFNTLGIGFSKTVK